MTWKVAARWGKRVYFASRAHWFALVWPLAVGAMFGVGVASVTVRAQQNSILLLTLMLHNIPLGGAKYRFWIRLAGEMPVDILRLKLASDIVDAFAVKL